MSLGRVSRHQLVLRVFFWVQLLASVGPLWTANAEVPEKKPSGDEEVNSNSNSPPKLVRKTKWIAQIVRPSGKGQEIRGLQFLENATAVLLVPREDVLKPTVEIVGHYDRRGWNLTSQGHALLGKLPDPTAFRFFSILNSPVNQVTLVAEGPNGQVEEETIMILAPDAKEFRISPPWGDAYFALGVASYSYFQTGFGFFDSSALALEAHYTTPRWKSRFGFHVLLKATVLTFSSSPSSLNPQVILGRVHGTYTFNKSPTSRLQMGMALGGTYLTMLSNGSPFGFANLFAGEIGVRARYLLSNVSTLYGNLNYSPLGSIFDFSQRGIDFRISFTTTLKNDHRIELGAGLSNHYFMQSDGVSQSQSNLMSFTVGYSI